MTTQPASPEVKKRLQNVNVRDIQKLNQQRGKIQEGNKEISLKKPSPSDPELQAILRDPACELRPTNSEERENERTFDLKSKNGDVVKITVECTERR